MDIEIISVDINHDEGNVYAPYILNGQKRVFITPLSKLKGGVLTPDEIHDVLQDAAYDRARILHGKEKKDVRLLGFEKLRRVKVKREA